MTVNDRPATASRPASLPGRRGCRRNRDDCDGAADRRCHRGDLVLAAESALLVSGFTKIGLVPEAGAAWQLTRKLGYQGRFDLLTSGRHLPAPEALRLGLVDRLVPDAELLDVAGERARQLQALPSHVVPLTKAVLRQTAELSWSQAIALEELGQPLCFSSRNHREAVSGLLEQARESRPGAP